MYSKAGRTGQGRGRWRRAALPVLVALSFAAPAMALTLEDCSRSADEVLGHHHGGGDGGGDAQDLGGSNILYRSAFAYGGNFNAALTLVNCRTGATLRMITVASDAKGRGYDKAETVEKLVRDLVRSPEHYSMVDVSRILKQRKIEHVMSTSVEEICPCMALYPQDRGQKRPYVYRPGIYVEPPQESGSNR